LNKNLYHKVSYVAGFITGSGYRHYIIWCLNGSRDITINSSQTCDIWHRISSDTYCD